MGLLRKENWKTVRYFTFGRIINALKLFISYSISGVLKRPVLWGLPLSIAYEPTTSCNLRCPECPSGLRSFTRPTGNAELEAFTKLIDQVKNHVFYLTLYFQGEPYLNADFFKMIEYAHHSNIYTSTSTNAHYLSKENCRSTILSGLDKLIISLDGISEDSYKKYRIGGDLKKVKEGIANLVEMKKELGLKNPSIIIQTIAFSHNEHELEDIKRLKNEWGVDQVLIKTAQVYSLDDSELLPKDPKLSRYKFQDGKYVLPENLPNKCWRMWSSPVITQNGDLIPCCFDKDGDHKMGNPVEEGDFTTIWKNKKYNSFRKQVYSNRKAIDICKNCSEGVKVWNE